MVLTVEAIAVLRDLFFNSGRSTPAADLDEFLAYMRRLTLPRAPYHDICIPKAFRLQLAEPGEYPDKEVEQVHYQKVRFYPDKDNFGSLGWRASVVDP